MGRLGCVAAIAAALLGWLVIIMAIVALQKRAFGAGAAGPAAEARAAVVFCRDVLKASGRQRLRLGHAVTGRELVFRNGVLMAPGLDYSIESGGYELIFVPAQGIGSGDVIQILH